MKYTCVAIFDVNLKFDVSLELKFLCGNGCLVHRSSSVYSVIIYNQYLCR